MSQKTVKTQDNFSNDQDVTPDNNVVGIFERLNNQNNPYLSAAANAARDDLKNRLPQKYAVRAAQALSKASNKFPNHNVLTLAAALAYADAGLHVIDSHALDTSGKGTGPGGQVKIPRGTKWQTRASVDHASIVSFWTGDGDYPADKNGAVYAYAPPQAFRNVSVTFPNDCGLFVMDIDGDAGKAALEKLEAEHGELPQTWESITGSGGYHLVFRANGADIRNTASSIAPGVDIRGNNGQIIAPPSIHPNGNFYQWDEGCAPWECDVAVAPDWLVTLSVEATVARDKASKTKSKKRIKKVKKCGENARQGDAIGFDAHLDTIGDGEDQRGFDGPIFSAACSYFSANGSDAGDDELFDILRATIAAAEMKEDRTNKDRYLSDDDYLSGRIEQAREFIAGQDQDGSPTDDDRDGFIEAIQDGQITASTVAEIKQAATDSGMDQDASEIDIEVFLRGCFNAGADKTRRGRINSVLAAVTPLTKPDIAKMWKELDKEAAQAEMDREVEARLKLRFPDYIPLEDATPESVKKAAAASSWLPKDWVCREECREWWFGYINYEKESKPFVAVCRAFEVAYNADGAKGTTRTNQLTIRYEHRSKGLGIVESTFRIGDTYKDSGTILGNLRNEGLDFHPQAKADVILSLLRAVKSKREAVYCQQSGWTKDRTAFVSSTGETVKKADDKKMYVLDHTMRVSADKAGTLEEWTNAADLALHGRNVSRFLPGFLGGAVGCLAHFIDTELCVIISNEGKAKHGKTTSLKAGVSWFAVAAADGLLITGDITTTAMETMAGKATGGMYAPDEQGTSSMTPEEQQRGGLIHAGGIGRGRGRADGGMRDTATWHCTLGMSSERSLLSQLEAENADVKAGAMSRIFTVNFDTAHQLDSVKDAAELAAYNVLAHGGAFGWAGIEFAAKLLEMGVDDVAARVSELEHDWGVGHVGAAERVVTTGALFGVAAEIAVEAGLLPDDVDLKTMLKGLLDETLAQRAHHLDTDRQGLDTLRHSIILAVNRRQIVEVGDTDEARGEILGYWTTSEGAHAYNTPDISKRTYILPVNRLGQLGSKMETGALVDQLREDGGLVPPSKKSKFVKQGLWPYTPGEGTHIQNVRVTGLWVHGESVDTDA